MSLVDKRKTQVYAARRHNGSLCLQPGVAASNGRSTYVKGSLVNLSSCKIRLQQRQDPNFAQPKDAPWSAKQHGGAL